MKALILAAGFGTRLLPFTKKVPKPLFTIQNTPLIDISISKLIESGCTSIEINTHHLAGLIRKHVERNNYSIPVKVVYEDKILETGGAIGNALKNYKGDLIVINGDILFDYDLNELVALHKQNSSMATLLMHDYEEFNNVDVEDGYVKRFRSDKKKSFAFTGIQIVSSELGDYIPQDKFISIIDIYKKMMNQGLKISAVNRKLFWIDIGTPENYSKAVISSMAPDLKKIKKVAGDGSDRKWYRAECESENYIFADHGISVDKGIKEVESFVKIGKHLNNKDINVPEIYKYDYISGIVKVEDLGSIHLKDYVEENDETLTFSMYRKVIDGLLKLSEKGCEGFNTGYCWQSEYYDKRLILEKECSYFYNEFVNGFCSVEEDYGTGLKKEFSKLADGILKNPVKGFMHRDFQSRNIMIKEDEPYFIDFQGGRIGPVEYDLASLLIDPYVEISEKMIKDLEKYFFDSVSSKYDISQSKERYKLCRISRNLQILGAFSFLSEKKGKKSFRKFIPKALKTLSDNVENCEYGFSVLKECINGCFSKLEKKDFTDV